MAGIQLLKKSLHDEFEVRGYWWIPGSKENVPGTLIRNENGTTLEIFGKLEETNQLIVRRIISKEESLSGENLSLEAGAETEAEIKIEEESDTEAEIEAEKNDGRLPEVIWGFTEKGEEITIYSYDLANSKMNFPGFQVESYDVSEFLVGRHVLTPNELELESVSVEFTYMAKWLEVYALHSSPIFKDGRAVGQQLQTVDPSNMNVEISAIDAILENTGIFNTRTDWHEKADLSFTSLFKLTANTSKDFEWYVDKIFSTQKLLTLLTGNSIYAKSISFKGVEETEVIVGRERQVKKDYKWFYDQINELEMKEKIKPHDFTIQYPEISELFPVIVNNWFEKESYLDVVYDLFTNEFYKTMNLTSTFLNYVQAIEVYHRRSYDGKIINDADYEIFQEMMREFIENEAPKELKPKLLGSLPYGNERTLNYRLKDLARSLQPKTKVFLFNSGKSAPTSLFQRIIDTRNYLTHYDPNNKNIIEVEDRYYAINILKAFVTVLLFKEIGMDEEFILNKLRKVRHLEDKLNEANEILEN